MWLYNNEELNEELKEQYVGFVYRITNLITGRQYIGKKIFKNTKSKIVKGKRKRTKVDSDWRTYFGSNKALLEDVKLYGADKFKREVIMFCSSKGSLNYYELKYQIIEGALESDAYYNEYIIARINQAHIKD